MTATLGLVQQIGAKAQNDMDEVGAAAFDFLMYSGYLSVAHVLLQQANCAQTSQNDQLSTDFKLAKQQTASFYFARILPRIKTHKALILSGNETLQCCEFDI